MISLPSILLIVFFPSVYIYNRHGVAHRYECLFCSIGALIGNLMLLCVFLSFLFVSESLIFVCFYGVFHIYDQFEESLAKVCF